MQFATAVIMLGLGIVIGSVTTLVMVRRPSPVPAPPSVDDGRSRPRLPTLGPMEHRILLVDEVERLRGGEPGFDGLRRGEPSVDQDGDDTIVFLESAWESAADERIASFSRRRLVSRGRSPA